MRKLAVPTLPVVSSPGASSAQGRLLSSGGVLYFDTGSVLVPVSAATGAAADEPGFRGIPLVSQSGNYTTVLADNGRGILHPSGGGAGDTFTIDSNANVPHGVGAAISFVNRDSNSLSIAIAADTLILMGTTQTGTRTLAQNGMATAFKVEATVWLISGVGLS